jgi:hypothetical protein
MNARFRLLFLSLAPAVLVACESAPPGGLVRCDPGQTAACACEDGATGTKTCRADGRYGPCQCVDPSEPLLVLGGDPDPTGAADRLLAIGPAPVGGTVEAILPIRNSGEGWLIVQLSTLDRPFTAVEVPAEPLGLGEERTLRFRFSPTRTGAAEALVTVISNGGNRSIRLTGTGFEAGATCTPEALDLGTLVVGQPVAFAATCVTAATSPWSATVRVEGADAAAIAVALDDPLPGDDGAWRLTGTATAGHDGSFAARLLLVGAGDLPLAAIPVFGGVRNQALELPGAIDLGYLAPGLSRTVTVEVKNYGRTRRTLAAGYLASASDTQLRLDTSFPLDLPALAGAVPGVATIRLSFDALPERLGRRANGLLQLRLDGEAGDRSIPVTGFVGGPKITCVPEALDFGPVAVGYPTTLPFICINTGTDDPGRDDGELEVEPSSSDPAIAVAVRDGLRTGYRVGESVLVDVTWTPTAAGPFDGALDIATNASDVPGGAFAIPIHGEARDLAPCDVEVIPGALDFGRLERFREATLEVAIRNRGTDSCQLRNLRLAADGDPFFSLPAGPVASALLAPGAIDRIPVRFSPLDESNEPFGGELRFEVSNPTAPAVVVPLSGGCHASCLVFDPAELDFGPVKPGCAGRMQTVRVTDTCTGRVVLGEVRPVPTPFPEFATGAAPITGPGGDATFEVGYRPADEGPDVGGFYVFDGGTVPYLLPARGEGSTVTRVDMLVQYDRPRADALFVIDNAAMLEVQDRLATNVPSLLSFARQHSIDYQIGVTSSGFSAAGCPGDAGGAESGRLVPVDNTRPRIVTPLTPNLETVLAANLHVGTCGFEHQLLEAALEALSPPAIDHCDDPRFPQRDDGNCGFLRDPAHLSIVTVTAAADGSPGTPAAYAAAFRALKAEDPGLVAFHAIAGEPTTGCSAGGIIAAPGDRLVDVVLATHGAFYSVCSTDFPRLAQELSREVFGFERCFPLGARPDPGADGVLDEGDLVVVQNGVAVPPVRNGASIWRLDADRGAVCFDVDSVPEPGDQLEVSYPAACLQP